MDIPSGERRGNNLSPFKECLGRKGMFLVGPCRKIQTVQ